MTDADDHEHDVADPADGYGYDVAQLQDSVGRIQGSFGIVARRAKDLELLRTLGDRVGYRLEGSYFGALSRLGLAGQCTVTELAEMLGLELSTVSRRVKGMEQRGLVERQPSPTDLRTSLLCLTPEGRALFEALSRTWRGMLTEMLTDWDQEKIDTFADLFDEFASELERYVTDPTIRVRLVDGDGEGRPTS